MYVQEFMTREPKSLKETDTLFDAVMAFMRWHFRHLPIVRENKLVGIVTERDIKQFAPSVLSGISADEYNRILETTTLSHVMIREPLTIAPNRPIQEAVELLYTKRIGCLPVVENGELVGIITTVDLLGLLFRIMQEKGMMPGAS